MAKVTILIETEDENGGINGQTTMVVKEDVVLIEELASVFFYAAIGAGWVIDGVDLYTDTKG